MLLVGLAGSLTTMSALSIDSVEMMSGGHYSQALINIVLNLALSLLAASLGVVSTKYLFNLG
jgi:CrcB protein